LKIISYKLTHKHEGRSGTSVVFCTQTELRELKRIESQCKIKFKRIGPPQLTDKVKSAGEVAKEKISQVDITNIELFQTAADELVATMGAAKAVAASLSLISGYTDRIEARSLLASLIGYKTIQIRGPASIKSPRYILNFLSRFDEKIPVKGIRLCTDGSAVADVPEGLADQITSSDMRHGTMQITIPQTLPDLLDDPRDSQPRSSPFSQRDGGGQWGGGNSTPRRNSGRRGDGGGRSGSDVRGGGGGGRRGRDNDGRFQRRNSKN
jgi:hypothetical protein